MYEHRNHWNLSVMQNDIHELTTIPRTFQASGLIDKMGGVDEMAKSTPTQRLGEPEVSSSTHSHHLIGFYHPVHS